jgi:hypothetical protein
MPNSRKATASFFPLGPAKGDGHPPIKVASRLGILSLPRQVLERPNGGGHVIPGNDLLPDHGGMLITRCLREWACLLPLDVGVETTQRLLGWITQEPEVMGATEVRRLVREHGQQLRAAEIAEAQALLADPERLAQARARLAPAQEPRRRAAWPQALTAVVEAALAEERPTPPKGVRPADWERVLAVRREQQEALTTAQLRGLGPQVAADQIVVGGDEVLVRQPKKRQFHELRTARIATSEGSRYLSGTGANFLLVLWVLLLLCGARQRWVTFVADGARWLREFYAARLQNLPRVECLLDWFHLCKRCRELTSMIGKDREARRELYRAVRKRLWQGEVSAAVTLLEEYRPQARNEARLEELIAYLQSRKESLVNYGERWLKREYIGSGGVEKGNDVIVARRMKRKGMHWSLETADSLAALKTLWLNHGWDLYWGRHEVLRLAAP